MGITMAEARRDEIKPAVSTSSFVLSFVLEKKKKDHVTCDASRDGF